MFRQAVLLLSALLISLPLHAQIGPMNYQGRLLDNAGVPVTGSHTFKVRIYDDPVLSTGKMYEEQHAGINVNDGVYQFLISEGSNLYGTWDINLWNDNNLYLEVEVDGETLAPRQRLAAAPFAFQANLALTTNNALALGGRSAEDYDNILADICVSSQGKWLDLAESCLGIGASFPGPSKVDWSTLSSDSDFTNIDLSRADISGIDFIGVDFSGSIFSGTTFSASSLDSTDLSKTTWDGAINTDTSVHNLDLYTVLNGATLQNMDLTYIGFTDVSVVNGLSVGNISACPDSNPFGWVCREMYAASGNWFMAGPGANLAAGSAASSFRFGSSYLDVERGALVGTDLSNAIFVGNVISQDFLNTNLTNANFDYTLLKNANIENATIDGTTFRNAILDKVTIRGTGIFDDANFHEAELNYVQIQKDATNLTFTNATLNNTSLFNLQQNGNDTLDGGNFQKAVLENVTIKGVASGALDFSNARFYNGFEIEDIDQAGATVTMTGTGFFGGTFSGDFETISFTNVVFDDVEFDYLDLCQAAFTNEMLDVTWGRVECPDGYNSNGINCVTSHWTPTGNPSLCNNYP